MKNILFFGGNGFLGSSIIEELIKSDVQVCLYVREKADLTLVNSFQDKINLVFGDLHDLDKISEVLTEFNIDTVVHLVSSLLPSSSYQEYLGELKNVVNPTISIINLLSQLKIKLVYFSSGGTIYGIKESGVFSETDIKKPISFYGQSKLLIEESILFENRRSDLQYLILRPSNPYGINQKKIKKQGLISTVINCLNNNSPITIWGDGSVVRDYIHISDFAKLAVNLVMSSEANEIFNIGSGIGYTIKDVISIINECNASESKIKILYEKDRSIDVPKLILDIDKINNKFKISQKTLKEGIKQILDQK